MTWYFQGGVREWSEVNRQLHKQGYQAVRVLPAKDVPVSTGNNIFTVLWSCFVLTCKTKHISPSLASLHWLPTDSWIQYKLTFLCCNCLNSAAAGDLIELLKVYKLTCQLCSFSDPSVFCLSSVHMQTLGQRSFSYAAPSVCNSFPCKVR